MDPVRKAVVVVPENQQDTKLYKKNMVELVQVQVKNPSLAIANPAPVRFHLQ